MLRSTQKNQTATAASITSNETESTISNIKHIIAIASGKEVLVSQR